MFRGIQDRIAKRADSIKSKTIAQSGLEKIIRKFLIEEFGAIGESLEFKASQENKKIHLAVENKTAAHELVLRSTKLAESLKAQNISVEMIVIR